MKTLVIDTETTGLDPCVDEILQLSIINSTGAVLYNKYLRPTKVTSWPAAQAVNGITPEMVAAAPTIQEEIPVINEILMQANVMVGYNICFDTSFLLCAGCELPSWSDDPPTCTYEDVMDLFAAIYGDFDYYHGSYTWKNLSVAAEYYKYDWGEKKAHDSLADCRATLFIWNTMLENGDKERAERLIWEANTGRFEQNY